MSQSNFAFYLLGQSAYHADDNQDGFYRKTTFFFFWSNEVNILMVSLLCGGLSGPEFRDMFGCVGAAQAMFLNCEAPSLPGVGGSNPLAAFCWIL